MHCHKPPEMCYCQQTEPPDCAGEGLCGAGPHSLGSPYTEAAPNNSFLDWISCQEEKCGPDTIPSLLAGYRNTVNIHFPLCRHSQNECHCNL